MGNRVGTRRPQRDCKLAALRRTENWSDGLPINTPTARHCPHDAATGNAAQYLAFVFNFA
jgi:hypothetical protein